MDLINLYYLKGAIVMADNKNFIGYEYRDVTVQGNMESVYADGYSNFGWILDKTDSSGLSSTKLKFKRDRQIPHKSELTGFQHQFDKSAREIVNLENSEGTGASKVALTIGFIGTVFMALSVFSVLADKIALCIVFAIPAFLGWILPYFIYKAVKNSRTKKVAPLIEKQYDSIYDVCKQANALLQS